MLGDLSRRILGLPLSHVMSETQASLVIVLLLPAPSP